MTTLAIGHGMRSLRLRGLALAVALGLLVWCACVFAVAWTSPQDSGSRPAVVLTPEPRPAGY